MSRFSFEDVMSRSELTAYVIDWLAHSLSKARILVNGSRRHRRGAGKLPGHRGFTRRAGGRVAGGLC